MRVAATVFCPFGRSYTANGVCALCILPESTGICCVAMRLFEIFVRLHSLQNNANCPVRTPVTLAKTNCFVRHSTLFVAKSRVRIQKQRPL